MIDKKNLFVGLTLVVLSLAVGDRGAMADAAAKQKRVLETFKIMQFDQLMTQTSKAVVPQWLAANKKSTSRHRPDVDQQSHNHNL